nr:hypothetical protein [uncultured Sphingomonas sp.]
MRNRLAGVLAMVTLAGCGKVADLEPAAGHTLPQKPALAATTPTANELLTLPPYARPDRIDELLKRGEQRQPDRFDMPPPSGKTVPKTVPAPNDPGATGTNTADTQPQETTK